MLREFIERIARGNTKKFAKGFQEYKNEYIILFF
jgi:hypothetical protein